MTDAAITVEGLHKRYELGTGHEGMLTSLIERALRRPFEVLRGAESKPREQAEEFWALRDVSFEVQRGEILGLVGANGAGKSTLLKILSRITEPTQGRVTMRGRVGSLLEVGTGFSPELTGRENVYLNGAILGMRRKEIDDKFDEIVEFSGIRTFLDTPVKRYSSGMYVRLAFAVAAHLETEILLVDEVLSVGDAEFQRKSLGKMNQAATQGRTVVFVSHNLAALQRLCTRAVWIDKGIVREVGVPAGVVASYLKSAGTKQHGGVAKVAEDAVRIGTGAVALRELAMLDEAGEPTDSLKMGQPFSFRLRYDVLEPVKDGVIELGIASADGERVVTVQSIDRGRPVLKLEPGSYEMTVQVDVTMLPGEFTIDAALHGLVGITHDLVERVFTFDALNVAYEGDDRWPWNAVRGSVRVGSDWSLRELPAGSELATTASE